LIWREIYHLYMQQAFSELIQYLDEKFQKSASKEDIVSLQARVDEKFTRAFDVFATKDELQELMGRVEQLNDSVHALTNAIDRLVKSVDDLRIEYSAMAMQLTRHEKWIQQLAEKLGLKLEQ